MTLFAVAAGVVALFCLLAVEAVLSRRREREWEQVRNDAADLVRQGNAMLDQVAQALVASRERGGSSSSSQERTDEQQFIHLFEQLAEAQIRKGKIDLSALAGQFCITRTQLNRRVKAASGMTSTDYIVSLRVQMAKSLLRDDSLSVNEVAYRCGIEDVPYFVTMFKKATGLTPGQYRRGRG